MDTGATSMRSPTKFFLLVFGLAIPVWILGAIVEPPEEFPIKLPVSALQLFCPLIAAAILVYREDRLAGIRNLLRRTVSYHGIKPRWLVAILLVSPTVYLLSYGVMMLLGRPLPDFQLPLADIPIVFAIFFVAAIAEEAGWTGYATDPLRARLNALPAALVLGAVWGMFHFVPDLQGGHDVGWIAWHHVVGAMALRVLIVWGYSNTGSVLAAVVMHTMDNLSWQVSSASAPYDPAITGPIYGTAAVLVTLLWGARTLAQYRFADRPVATPSVSPTMS